jgi:hypothetical protein
MAGAQQRRDKLPEISVLRIPTGDGTRREIRAFLEKQRRSPMQRLTLQIEDHLGGGEVPLNSAQLAELILLLQRAKEQIDNGPV